jgi:hypothetical protein
MDFRNIIITCLVSDVLQEPRGNSNYYTLRCFTSTDREEQPQRKPINIVANIRGDDTGLIERAARLGRYDTIVINSNYFDVFPWVRNDGTAAATLQLYPAGRSAIRLVRRHPNNRTNANEAATVDVEMAAEEAPAEPVVVSQQKKMKAVATGTKVSVQDRVVISEPTDTEPEDIEGDPFADMDSDPFA